MKIDIKKVDDNTYEVASTNEPHNKNQIIRPNYVTGSVHIDGVSPKYLTDIALLVDRDDFLADIKKLRKKWKIDRLIEFKYADDLFLTGWINNHLGSIFNSQETEKLQKELKSDIASLRVKYGRTPNYDQVILWVLFTSTVPDGVYRSCYFTTISEPETEDSARHRFAILLDGRTELSELKKAFEDFKHHLKYLEFTQKLRDEPIPENFDSLIANMEANRIQGVVGKTANRYKVRTQANILLIRELYWKRKLYNTSFEKLASEANSKCDGNHLDEDKKCMFCVADEVNVRKNIENYEKTVNRKL